MDTDNAIFEFDRVHTILEIADMYNDTQIIEQILNEKVINIAKVEREINIIDDKHPDNVILYKKLFSPNKNLPKFRDVSYDDEIKDLSWKRYYLYKNV
jgi:hypothetical protein